MAKPGDPLRAEWLARGVAHAKRRAKPLLYYLQSDPRCFIARE
jgi:hypothetical protein